MSRIFYISKPLLFVVSIIIVLACGKQRPSKRDNNINKITIGIGGSCFVDECKNFAVSIDSSLSYSYYGCTHAKQEGYYKGTISQGTWDTLNMKVESLHPHYNISDSLLAFHPCLGFEAIIHDNDKIGHFACFTNQLRTEWIETYTWMKDSIEVKNLVSTVPMAFETTIHNPKNHRILDSLWRIEHKGISNKGTPFVN